VSEDPSAISQACEGGAAAPTDARPALRRRPEPPRTYTRHGLNASMARVKLRGFRAIDRRMVAARQALGWRRELLEDLGGETAVSAAQLALVEVATRTRLFIDHADAVLMGRESLVVRGRRLLPLVEQRQRLVDSLARLLGQLGLERRKPPVPSPEAWVAAARPASGEAAR